MFSKNTYIQRRSELKRLVGNGIIILFGNNESPCNYPANAYYPFRQDSSFLYYFGQKRDGLVGVIDIDNDKEWLIGDDIDIEDIVWYGSVDSVADMAAQVGVAHTAPMSFLSSLITPPEGGGRAGPPPLGPRFFCRGKKMAGFSRQNEPPRRGGG